MSERDRWIQSGLAVGMTREEAEAYYETFVAATQTMLAGREEDDSE